VHARHQLRIETMPRFKVLFLSLAAFFFACCFCRWSNAAWRSMGTPWS